MADNNNYLLYNEIPTQECCADSNVGSNDKNSGREEEKEEDESVESLWTIPSNNGNNCSAHNSTSKLVKEMEDSLETTWTDDKHSSYLSSMEASFVEMEDSLETAWTDDKHSSYLSSMEASFVEQMYENKFCALDLCDWPAKKNESFDPDSAESRPNFPSLSNKFKVFQKGGWQKHNYNRAWHLGVSTPQAVLASPCIHNFIRAPYFKGHEVPSRTVDESCGEHGISTIDDLPNNALELNHFCHMKTVHATIPDANQNLSVQHQRLGNICTQKSLVHAGPVHDKGDQDIMRGTDLERNRINRTVKKQKMKIESISCSERDQVVPWLQSLHSADSGDSITKLNKKSTSRSWNDKNGPVTIENKCSTENDDCSTRKNGQENTVPHIRQESAICSVVKTSSLSMLTSLDFNGRSQSEEENS